MSDDLESVNQLHAVIASVYERHRERDIVSPSWLATEVMVDIAFPRELHRLGYLGCHLQVRQIARGFCRTKCDPLDGQEDLFGGTLQQRYPRAGTNRENPEYIRRELMSDADIGFNVSRLRAEASAKLDHADALEAWGLARRAAA